MTTFKSAHPRRETAWPRAAGAVGLLLAAIGALLPEPIAETVRRPAVALAAPGQWVVERALSALDRWALRGSAAWGRAETMARAQRTADRLAAQNAALLAQLRAAQEAPRPPLGTAPLVRLEPLPARVLGSAARRFLCQRALLTAGAAEGTTPGAWVTAHDDPQAGQTWIDQGSAAALAAGHHVVAKHVVWGRVARVDQHTALVRQVTDPAFRDLVRIGSADSLRAVEGILAGTGETLCRITRVEAAAPVAAGDAVYATGEAGDVWRYGVIERARLAPGGAHWELWMRPAASGDWPPEVEVWRLELNLQRLAAPRPAATGGVAAMAAPRKS